jgi:hypothetical protein
MIMTVTTTEVRNSISEYNDKLLQVHPSLNFIHLITEFPGHEVPLSVGKTSFVERSGYNESNDLWLIFQIGDQFFRITGYRDSYDGDEWHTDVEEMLQQPRSGYVYVTK